MVFDPPRASQVIGNSLWHLVYGPPKAGKTTFAAQLSQYFPDTAPDGTFERPVSPIYLEDLFWFGIDKDGLLSLTRMNLDVACVDLGPLTSIKDITNERDKGIKLCREGIAAGKTRAVVVDTISSLDAKFKAALKPLHDTIKNPGGYWQDVAAKHAQFAREFLSLNVPVMWLVHAKEAGVYIDKDGSETVRMAQKDLARGLPGGGSIDLQISGQTKDFYVNQCSALWPLQCIRRKNKPTVRKIYPHGNSNFKGGCRYAMLAEEEPANLKAIFAKIKGESV